MPQYTIRVLRHCLFSKILYFYTNMQNGATTKRGDHETRDDHKGTPLLSKHFLYFHKNIVRILLVGGGLNL
jgi:hypothetical protein